MQYDCCIVDNIPKTAAKLVNNEQLNKFNMHKMGVSVQTYPCLVLLYGIPIILSIGKLASNIPLIIVSRADVL